VNPKFCVYIVESVSMVDFQNDRQQGHRLCQMLSLSGTPARFSIAVSEGELYDRITAGVLRFSEETNLFPVLHIIAHGNPTGIVLCNQTEVSWSRLSQLLEPFFTRVGGSGILCMSSCDGLYACGIALTGNHFRSVVGAKGSIRFLNLHS
jgi:hypothetical protein